ncbi:MAG: hypothetical protein HOV81_01185 [Kofleriaceae bacterium]|nr:hypothetical protein [Kofleriaceae bacterium]
MRRLLAFASCLVGCYSPQPPAGAPCPDGACPDGLVCSPATQTCERRAVDAGAHDATPGDGRLADASIDAAIAVDAPTSGAILVQQKGRERIASSSLATTLDVPPVAGHTLVMIGGGPVAPLVGVSGGGIATWTRAAFSPVAANVEIWYGVTDGSSSTVTITAQSAASSLTMLVTEWSGIATTLALDGAAADAVQPGEATAGQIATTNAHDLVLFAVASFTPNTYGTLSGYTALTSLAGTQTGVSQVAWYREVTTTGTFAPSVSVTNSEWDACLVALELAP